jgi:hypothetical protein
MKNDYFEPQNTLLMLVKTKFEEVTKKGFRRNLVIYQLRPFYLILATNKEFNPS